MKWLVILLLAFNAHADKRGWTKDGFISTNATTEYSCSGQSTSSTWVDCGDALPLPDNSGYKVVAECTGIRSDNAEFAAIDKCGMFRRDTGATTLEGSVVTSFDQPGTSNWDTQIIPSGNDVKVQFKSPSETVNWNCRVRMVKKI